MSRSILRLQEVSDRTGIPEATLRYWRHLTEHGTPTGPRSYKLGRRVVYDEPDVMEWLHEQRRGAGQARPA